jgi:uncharacterized protein YdhG (YjbR/CyaY superfamily)
LKPNSKVPKTIDEYLATVPEPARSTLNKIRATISYQIPTFKYKGGLVAFAAFKNHCSFFPMSSSLVGEFKDELKNFPTSKGTIRFPVDKPLPAPLVKKLVKARVAQNELKEQRRSR